MRVGIKRLADLIESTISSLASPTTSILLQHVGVDHGRATDDGVHSRELPAEQG